MSLKRETALSPKESPPSECSHCHPHPSQLFTQLSTVVQAIRTAMPTHSAARKTLRRWEQKICDKAASDLCKVQRGLANSHGLKLGNSHGHQSEVLWPEEAGAQNGFLPGTKVRLVQVRSRQSQTHVFYEGVWKLRIFTFLVHG